MATCEDRTSFNNKKEKSSNMYTVLLAIAFMVLGLGDDDDDDDDDEG